MFRHQVRAIPFIRLLLPFVTGICLATYAFPYLPLLKDWMIGLVLFCILAAQWISYMISRQRPYLYSNCLHLSLCLLGFCITLQHYSPLQANYFAYTQHDHLLIRIDEPPLIKANGIRVTASVLSDPGSGEKLCGYLMMRITDTTAFSLAYGDLLLIRNTSRKTSAALNPGAFDYRKYLSGKGIFQQAYLREGDWVRIAAKQGNPLISYSDVLARKLVNIYREHLPDEEVFSVCSALILGYRADMDEEIVSAYAQTGTLHILSVSGLHVGIIYIVLEFLLKFLPKTRSALLFKSGLMIWLIWLYAFVTGLSPSVTRSALMISLVITAKTLNRRSNTYNVIAFSAGCQLMYNPLLIHDIGFLLSYLAVVGIIYFQPIIYRCWSLRSKYADQVWMMSSVSLAAQLSTLPISLYYFHQFPNYFLLANLLVIPLSGLVLYLGILLLCVHAIPYVSLYCGMILSWSVKLLDGILFFIADLPHSLTENIAFPPEQLVLAYLLMILLCIYFQNKRILSFRWICVALLLLAISGLYHAYTLQHTSRLIVLAHPRKMMIAIQKGKQVDLLCTDTVGAEESRYLVAPLIQWSRADVLAIHPLGEDHRNTGFSLRKKFMQWKEQRICLLDDTATIFRQPGIPGIDLIICNQPSIDLHKLFDHMPFNSIVISSRTTGRERIHLYNESQRLPCKIYFTFESGAYILSSSP